MKKIILLIFIMYFICFCSESNDNNSSKTDTIATDQIIKSETEGNETIQKEVYKGEIKNGNYVYDDGAGSIIKINIAESKYAFITEYNFVCEGKTNSDTPCKYKSAVSELTCNQAFSKGLFTMFENNTIKIDGKDGTFEFYFTSQERIEGVYHLKPAMCCSSDILIVANWKDAKECVDFTTEDCDPYKNSGCDQGFHCTFQDNKPVCIENGEKEIGDECKYITDCKKGICVDIGNTGSKCYDFCKKPADCYPQSCIELTNSTWKVCSLSADKYEQCNLLQQNCEGNKGCYLTGLANTPICIDSGKKQENESCEQDSDCIKGLVCYQDKKCHILCNTAGGEPKCENEFAECDDIYPPQQAGVCKE